MFYVQCIETHYINDLPFVKGELFTFTEIQHIGLNLPCNFPDCIPQWVSRPNASIGKFILVSGNQHSVELKKTIDCGEFYGIERNLHRVGVFTRRLKLGVKLKYYEGSGWAML